MTYLQMACAIGALAVATGAFAQTQPSDPAAQANMSTQSVQEKSSTSTMQPEMSAKDTKTMKACEGMETDAMMANAGCKALMAKYPGVMSPNPPMNDSPPTPR